MKEMSDIVGRELMDYNLRDALSQNLNSTSEFYYSKQIKFTDKKSEERFTSFVCMKDLKARVEEIMRRRGVSRVLTNSSPPWPCLTWTFLDNLDELTDTALALP